jgi:hypothetical protein
VSRVLIYTSYWGTGDTSKPCGVIDLIWKDSASTGRPGDRYRIIIDGRPIDLGELREHPIVEPSGKLTGEWLYTADLTPDQMIEVVRATRIEISAGLHLVPLTDRERDAGRAVFTRAVCGAPGRRSAPRDR